jgi:hypothetical protein
MGDNSVDNHGITAGAEVWVAARRPSRLAGLYGRVIECDESTGEILVELSRGRCEWMRAELVVPVYGAEL